MNRCEVGDCRVIMRSWAAAGVRVRACVTSPPYFGLRDYGHPGQLGLEDSPQAYVAALVDVFEAVRALLRDDGTLWLNLGDCYAGTRGPGADMVASRRRDDEPIPRSDRRWPGFKSKDLMGMPWRVAFALQEAGWYLRQDII
jgi:site-specific DNA-methyltransferase (cytosine-N4-specific)